MTFANVLSACSHSGLIDEGVRCFDSMQTKYHIQPTKEHFGCLVDLFARGGQLDKAEDVLMTNESLAGNPVMWMTLLGGCRSHGDVERAERVAARIWTLVPEDAAAYVLLGNIYAAAGRWEDERRVRRLMKERGIQKEPGQSWIEVDGKVHTFLMDDRNHPERKAIEAMMEEVSGKIMAMGHVPDTRWVLRNVDEEHKQRLLCRHSEKLAIAYGLMRTPPGSPLIVVNNLRMCGDCHSTTKLIAKAYGREIKVRDASRYHHFCKDHGTCSCCDYF